ncbi:STAS domain-containing protein [Mycolicibacterium monacense]|uniref:Anti-sigma factor antagonist n=1 Tax=Mycolicibacterium monacense TaxID=85693 RepID=A0AAD1J1Q8_MYCMB|nr:STAS domain-containing protein [Mycolicibacterium monacense]MDA4103278.1 anti-sigma factor antagonist [Mycolicibacterium monacense DSM 44395]OBF56194.1 anti-anti-sigma factor [Mycolicibacterium monacense]ORB12926.1 anti-anti-sigma factor [Mycolicibacterium monacense DSM 44395]QHP88875.1 anti-sigma factor antagonist [Mycolicibacterium monacense DSM 44395]BBZ63665.1 anti-sigma factor antagonist [Mycolicibacterium monacense]
MQPLEVEHDVRGNAVVVRVKGDVDSLSVDALNSHLAKARGNAVCHPSRLVVIDLSEVTYFGSAALNAVLSCHEEGAAEGTSVAIVADQPYVMQPIQITGLHRVLETHPTIEQALQRDGQSPDGEGRTPR